MKNEFVGDVIMAFRSDVLYYTALNTSGIEFYHTSTSFFTCDPVVDVGFHHELTAEKLPQVEVHGVVVFLTYRRSG